MTTRTSIHGEWSSRLIFILAASGSAVGLGNIWKFPYIAGENGGGAFVLLYLACIALVGVPIMMAEVLLGRRGRQSPINTMRSLARAEGLSPAWTALGWGGVIAGFLILSYYSVIAGWALAYVFRAGGGLFAGLDAEGVEHLFTGLVSDPWGLLGWHSLFMVMTTLVVGRGVRDGLEQAVRVLMPGLFLLLLVLVGYALTTRHFGAGLEFLFKPDFNALLQHCEVLEGVKECRFSGTPVLVALGHAFFTLSLGMGAIMVYGSYMPHQSSIASSVLLIAGLDTLVALLAGMAIFPIVFANGLEPAAGPGLIFQTLPLAFGAMPGGSLFATLFFLLLVFAAWTSAISLIEPAVAWLVENRGMGRFQAALWIGLTAWTLGLGTVFSFNIWADYTWAGRTLFDWLDFLTANIMLPLGGLFIALFVGWFLQRRISREELQMDEHLGFKTWWLILRFVSPILVLIIFLHALWPEITKVLGS